MLSAFHLTARNGTSPLFCNRASVRVTRPSSVHETTTKITITDLEVLDTLGVRIPLLFDRNFDSLGNSHPLSSSSSALLTGERQSISVNNGLGTLTNSAVSDSQIFDTTFCSTENNICECEGGEISFGSESQNIWSSWI